MSKYAVLIGNASFPNESSLQDLRCPLLDVEGLEKVLKTNNRGDFDEVLVLQDKSSDDVLRGLSKVLNKARKKDLVLIYYSGHGKQSKSGQQLYLTSFNTEVDVLNVTAVGLNKVYELINDSSCHKIVLILDCCYSGVAGKSFKGDIVSKLEQANATSRGTYLITASTEIQVAEERLEDDYSLFTKHLIEGLESGLADKDGDGLITIDELYQYVHDKVLDENKNQQPTKTSKGEHGEIFIAKSGRNSREELKKEIYQRLLELSGQSKHFAKILAEWVTLSEISAVKFTPLQQKKYCLLKDLINKPLDPFDFSFEWSELNQFEQANIETEGLQPIQKAEIERKKQAEIKASTQSKKSANKANQPIKKPTKSLKKIIILLITGGLTIPVYYSLTESTIFSTPTPDFKEPEMVFIKGGSFQMGSPESEKNRESDEKQHSVNVADFDIGKYEVTKMQFSVFVKAANYKTDAEIDDGCYGWTGSTWEKDKKYSWRNLGFEQTDNHPVACVSFNDAVAYTEWLSKETKKEYRLPTEAEWEYAARAGTTEAYPWGKEIGVNKANCYKAYCDDSFKFTAPVGSFNAYNDLYDMHGNVWEWTCSKYENYNGNENKCLSKNDAKIDSLVIRGGSWYNLPRRLRSAYRNDGNVTYRIFDLGFRISRTR